MHWKMLKAFVNFRSHYQAILPYNLSWQIRNVNFIHDFLTVNPLNIIDIGARGNSIGEIDNLRPYINYMGFEADETEASLLEKINPGFNSYKIYPIFVGDINGEKDFYLFKNRGESSSLLPNELFKNDFGGESFSIENKIKVNSLTLDSIIRQELIEIDFIKLDTQGTELDILISSPHSVEQAVIIEIEAEFYQIYKDQSLFYDIGKHLTEKGYQLLYLNRVFANRRIYDGEARGQVIFCDALFGKDNSIINKMSDIKKMKYIIMLINYGHLDLAYQILKENDKLINLVPNIGKFFKIKNGILCKIKRNISMQIDKVISFLLYLRKTNKLRYDSDRSWPIR